MKREEAINLIGWMKSKTNRYDDLEAIDMAIEALQAQSSHGRLIDADALLDKLPKEYFGSTIHMLINDAPTVPAGRPLGEWVDVNGDGSLWRCDQCKDTACCDGNFCPTCGARMKGCDDE